jgi:hypothetical protein
MQKGAVRVVVMTFVLILPTLISICQVQRGFKFVYSNPVMAESLAKCQLQRFTLTEWFRLSSRFPRTIDHNLFSPPMPEFFDDAEAI